MRHVKPARSGIALLIMLAAWVLPGVLGRGTVAWAQTPIAGTLSVDSRSMQPGELVVVNATLPEDVTDVRVIGLDRSARAYRVDDTRWQALLGIDLDAEAGEQPIRLEGRRGVELVSMETRIAVLPKDFPTRRLKVSPDFVNPPKPVQERIARESELLQKVLGASADERLWSAPFVRPVPHRTNSRFGTRSVFNGEPRNPHSGTDFLSPAGTPVRAPAAGRVVLAQPLYFSGRTVIIDHGLDVFSQLLHLSRIDVMAGDTVTAGTVVGLVGATGRVTGAHLHWSLRVGGARVDPLAALELLGDAPSP